MENWMPEKGEMIKVSDEDDYWYKHEFFAYADGAESPWLVWNNNKSKRIILSFKFARPIQKEEEIKLYDVVADEHNLKLLVVVKIETHSYHKKGEFRFYGFDPNHGFASWEDSIHYRKISDKIAVAPALISGWDGGYSVFKTSKTLFVNYDHASLYYSKGSFGVVAWPSRLIDFIIVDKGE